MFLTKKWKKERGFIMEREKLEKIIKERFKERERVSCAQALKLAEELDIPPKQITEIFNEINIKVHACQLGCF